MKRFLIAAEAIASKNGLGYRIFLVRRYLAMEIILTYVIGITFLASLIDWLLRVASRRFYPWAEQTWCALARYPTCSRPTINARSWRG